MDKSQHSRYIASPAWKRRRARYFQGHPRRCVACGTTKGIELHHVSYARAGAGHEPDDDLAPLCAGHHRLAHTYEKSGRYGRLFAEGTLRRATAAMIAERQHPAYRARQVPYKRTAVYDNRGWAAKLPGRLAWCAVPALILWGWGRGQGWW